MIQETRSAARTQPKDFSTSCQPQGSPDVGEMRQGLRKIPKHPAGDGVDLLGIQPYVVGTSLKPFKEPPRFIPLSAIF